MKTRPLNLVMSGLVCVLPLVRSAGAQSPPLSWQLLAPMPTARQELGAAAFEGKIYVLGGYDIDLHNTASAEVYDPATNSWSLIASLPSPCNHNVAVAAALGLYHFNTSLFYRYEPETNSWIQKASSLTVHGATPAIAEIDGKIYVAGGIAQRASRELEVYDPATNSWSLRAPMNIARHHCAGGVINGKFYVAAGRGSLGADTDLEVYDPATNAWATLAPMNAPRSGVAAAAVNGELYVFGGELPGTVRQDVEAYNPATNTWRTLPPMPRPRHGIQAAVIGNRIFIPGGATVEGFGGAADYNDVATVGGTSPSFASISTRMRVETGDNVLIGGIIAEGPATKRVIVRAIGPTLPVPGPLMDPTLEIYNAANQPIASNDNWNDSPGRDEIIAAGLAPLDPRESAVVTQVPAGNTTAIVRGVNNTTGIALVQVYDVEPGSATRLVAVSTRGLVQGGDNLMIGGISVTGENSRVIVRALGPSLSAFGVNGVLQDPNLELRDANGGLVAANDDWRSAQEAEIVSTGRQPGDNRESAIVRTLLPGNYTALVRGAGETTGVALVEAYALQ